jgi:hypothetical protein
MKKLFSIVLIAVLSLGIAKAQTVIFYEDFHNGINPAWSNTGTAVGAANSWAKWRYTHSGSHGAYGSPLDTIHSITPANGWIIFDSDSLDNGGVAGAFGQGPAPAPQTVNLTTSAISVAGTPYCKLTFNQYFRQFQSTTVVGISTDGVNFTLDTVNTDASLLDSYGATSPSSQITIDLTPYILAGGPAQNVYISFIMDANYYFWQIDDITITTLPNNDLQAISTVGQSGSSGLGLFYSSIPASEADSFAAFTTYGNIGQVSQPNTKVQQKELQNGTQVGSTYLTTPPVALLPYGVDTFDANIWYTQGIGKYLVAAYVSSDSTDAFPANNYDTLSFAVTDTVFSINSTTTQDGYIFPLDQVNEGNSFRVGTLFELDNADTVTSVTTAIAGGSSNLPGTVIQATIYPVTVTSTALQYSSPAVSTFPKTLTAANISSTTAGSAVTPIVMSIDNSSGNAVLSPGVYWVAIGVNSTPDTVVYATLTHYQKNGFPVVEQNSTLYYLGATDAAYCNLNFGHPSSLLYISWTRNPATTPVTIGRNITFSAITNASASATYSWTMTGINSGYSFTSVAKNPTQAFPAADSFQVCVTVTDGGNSANYCGYVRVRDWGTGIDDLSALDNLSMVPNPTTGKVNISADITGATSVTIVNTLGEVVRTFSEDANGSFNKTYDLSALSSGIYLVKIANGGNVVTKKLSISK